MSKNVEEMTVHYKREVQQLRAEASIPRTKVSESLKSLMDYTNEHKQEDFLVSGATQNVTENPFQEKKKCNML